MSVIHNKGGQGCLSSTTKAGRNVCHPRQRRAGMSVLHNEGGQECPSSPKDWLLLARINLSRMEDGSPDPSRAAGFPTRRQSVTQSRQNFVNHAAADIREPEISPGIAVGELLVIEPEK